ncbi:hypothetical protein T4A_1863 [Trichinella pseudospiralis]|uniref:Uncharacterized protein n=1 Tax=Trichinella pseudospiralis TaxID=6337 RepID=A0A0V1EN32_TRIPS|nr:hypothetical protein T4A_1863 [Trichinella pseudospiralis]
MLEIVRQSCYHSKSSSALLSSGISNSFSTYNRAQIAKKATKQDCETTYSISGALSVEDV